MFFLYHVLYSEHPNEQGILKEVKTPGLFLGPPLPKLSLLDLHKTQVDPTIDSRVSSPELINVTVKQCLCFEYHEIICKNYVGLNLIDLICLTYICSHWYL